MKKLKEFVGFYTIRILGIKILIACFDGADSFPKIMKKNKEENKFLVKAFKEITINDGSGVIFDKADYRPYLLYIHSCYRINEDEFDDVLIHETNHLVDKLAKYCAFENEGEFRAYLQVHLKQEIKKIFKVKNKKGG